MKYKKAIIIFGKNKNNYLTFVIFFFWNHKSFNIKNMGIYEKEKNIYSSNICP